MRAKTGIALIEIGDCYFLAADKEARKTCAYICRISETAAFVWKLILEGKNKNEILTLLNEEYDVPANVDLNNDVVSFFARLKEQNYLVFEDEIA